MNPRIQRRYAPMSREHIPGFPHKMPQVCWDDNLPVFQGEKFEDPLLHLIKCHIHIWKVKTEWHEDCLMKMFMLTLEEKARDWYERLEPRSLFSLKDMHQVFYEKYKENPSSIPWTADCCDLSQNIIQYLLDRDEDLVNMHPEDLLEAIQEFHMHPDYHKNLDESTEAQEDIQPPIQSSQETESCCASAQRNTRPSSPLTEEETDQSINAQPTSEIFCKTDILVHSADELCCTDLTSSFASQNEERSVENPVCLVGNITYINDFPNFDLSDDDVSQTKIDLTTSSLADLWEEDQFQQLQRSNEPMQAIYDTDEESYNGVLADEYSLNLHSALPHIISETGYQQLLFSEDEEESKEEDNTAIYDKSSSSEDNGDSLSQESLILDPVEEEEILVETSLLNTHNQVSFHDPYVHLMQTFEEGSKVLLGSMLRVARNFFVAAIEEQKEWEQPCLSNLLRELSKKDQSWDHLIDWLHWKTMFVS